MKNKEHKITTIQDMLNVVTEENIDAFMADLRAYIEIVWGMQKLFNSIADAENIPQDAAQLISEFTWIDDGKQKHKIILDTK